VSENDEDDSLEALGARGWGEETLRDFLDQLSSRSTDPTQETTSTWTRDDFRDLVEAIQAAAPMKGREAFLDRWRVGGERPAPIVPCEARDGAVVGVPPPRRREAGGQTEEEKARSRQEDALYLRGSTKSSNRPPPPSLRVRFVVDDLLGDRTSDWRSFCQAYLAVRPYEPDEVLEQIGLVTDEAEPKELGEFILDLLRGEKREPWQLEQHAFEGVAPAIYFAGPGASHPNARRGLASLLLPSMDGRLLPGPALRFTRIWGSEYAPLDDFDPPSAIPLCPPDTLRAWLGDATTAEARALARLCGVWETAPLGWFYNGVSGVPLSEVEARMPDAQHRAWARGMASTAWKFVRSYPHQHVCVQSTVWLRDLPQGSPSRSRALLSLLDRDWGFFTGLGRTALFCPGCRGGGGGWSHGRDNCPPGEAPELAFRDVLSNAAWYHRLESEEAPTPIRQLIKVEKPPPKANLRQSRWQFLPHLRNQVEADSPALNALGARPVAGLNLDNLLRLMERLRLQLDSDPDLRFSRGGMRRAAFIALHREEVYPRLSQLASARPMTAQEMSRLDAIGWLAELPFGPEGPSNDSANGAAAVSSSLAHPTLAFLPAHDAFIDNGNDPVGRTRFRSKAAFHVAETEASSFARTLGAPEFLVIATPHPEGARDITDIVRAVLDTALPAIVALMSRVVPGGGRPADIEEEAFGNRLARLRALRFVHCEDLKVDLVVSGPPLLEIKGVGARGHRDRFLDLNSSPPILYFDQEIGDEGVEGILPEVSTELARALEAPAYGPLFSLLLQRKGEARLPWLEELGVTQDDIKRASRTLGLSSERGRAVALLLWSALVEAGPDDDRTWASAFSDASALVRGEIPSGEGVAPAWRVAASSIPILAEREALRRGGPESVLRRIENAGWDIKTLSDAMKRRGLEAIDIRDHDLLLRTLGDRHRQTVEALLRRCGAGDVEHRLTRAFSREPTWRHRPEVPVHELLSSLRAVLDEMGLDKVPIPDPLQSAAEWREAVAAAVGISTADLVSFLVEDKEAHARRDDRTRARWLHFLVALTAGDCHTEAVRAAVERCKECLTGRSPDEGADDWLILGGYTTAEAGRIVSALRSCEDVGLSSEEFTRKIGEVAGVPDLPHRLKRVRQMLDEKRIQRLDALTEAHLRQPEGPVKVVSPPEGAPSNTPGPKAPAANRGFVKPGAKPSDQAERNRNARLGARGEDIVFRWAVEPLLKLRNDAPSCFRKAVESILDWLRNTPYRSPPSLFATYESHALEVLDQTADAEDTLLALETLMHLSGDRGSDGLGFDVVGWDVERSRPVAIEVKTGVQMAGDFHMTDRQWDVATILGDVFWLVRVSIATGERARMLALRDPTRLPGDVLKVEGETFRCRLLKMAAQETAPSNEGSA